MNERFFCQTRFSHPLCIDLLPPWLSAPYRSTVPPYFTLPLPLPLNSFFHPPYTIFICNLHLHFLRSHTINIDTLTTTTHTTSNFSTFHSSSNSSIFHSSFLILTTFFFSWNNKNSSNFIFSSLFLPYGNISLSAFKWSFLYLDLYAIWCNSFFLLLPAHKSDD